MLILALDSTALCASVALLRDGHLLAEYTVNTVNHLCYSIIMNVISNIT